jgi:hypothetical protein
MLQTRIKYERKGKKERRENRKRVPRKEGIVQQETPPTPSITQCEPAFNLAFSCCNCSLSCLSLSISS